MAAISTRVHGVLDYAVGLGLMAAPRVLGFQDAPRAARVPVALGASALAYSLLTDYELGALRVLPMPAHLLLDAMNGLFLAASPWLLGFAKTVRGPHVALGVLELLVVAGSERQPRRMAGGNS
jgi:hypothetical protein